MRYREFMKKPLAVLAAVALGVCVGAQRQPTDAEVAISNQLSSLRSLPDDQRAKATREIAFQIRKLPAGPPKVNLASSLTNLSTEGDFGRGTLQAVADTLVAAVKEAPPARKDAYVQLANLARYEGIKVELTSGSYTAALAEVDALSEARKKIDFTLTDRTGKSWTLSELKGKVVLVNFWATWCPPCRKEMPDLDALHTRFKDKGLVILAISDEKPEVVDAYLKEHPVAYPILLDPDRKVNTAFQIDGIPKNLIYDRKGKLVAQSIDMRTMNQFLGMLSKAGLK
ncbi:TlpA family protein disulfide reductase [bacterium]|nr:MAG: TlpA family protein disulfide reductase [bacterium]